MKAFLLAVGLLTIAPAKPAPFVGANVIVIEPPQQDAEGLSKLADIAKQAGYTVDTLTVQKLVTVPRPYEFRRNGIITPVTHKFRATANGRSIELTGVIRGKLNLQQDFESSMGWYSAKEESQDKACFTQAQKLALAYAGAKVGYSKR